MPPVTPDVVPARSRGDLTPRERDVLRLVGSGRSNQQIAETLGLSMNSVKSYIRAAYRKIDAESRTQALLWCVDHGLVEGRGRDGRTREQTETGGAPEAVEPVPVRAGGDHEPEPGGGRPGHVAPPRAALVPRVVGPVSVGSGADVHALAHRIRLGLRSQGRFRVRLDDDDRHLALLHRAVRAAVMSDPAAGSLAVTVSYAHPAVHGARAVAVVQRAS